MLKHEIFIFEEKHFIVTLLLKMNVSFWFKQTYFWCYSSRDWVFLVDSSDLGLEFTILRRAFNSNLKVAVKFSLLVLTFNSTLELKRWSLLFDLTFNVDFRVGDLTSEINFTFGF